MLILVDRLFLIVFSRFILSLDFACLRVCKPLLTNVAEPLLKLVEVFGLRRLYTLGTSWIIRGTWREIQSCKNSPAKKLYIFRTWFNRNLIDDLKDASEFIWRSQLFLKLPCYQTGFLPYVLCDFCAGLRDMVYVKYFSCLDSKPLQQNI